MVSLDARPPLRGARSRNAGAGRDGTRTEWLLVTGAAAAVLGAAVAMAVLSAITVLLWAAGPIASEGLSAAPFRGAASLWLMGQRAPLDAGTYDLVLPPLVVSAVVVVLTARLAGWAARATASFELAPAAIVGGGVVLGHVLVAGIAGWVSARAGSGVDVLDAMRAGFVFAVPCVAAGIAPQTWVWAKAAARHGARVRVVARAAGKGALALGAGGAAVLLVSLVMHHRSASDLLNAVGGGVSGGAGTTLLCLAMAPNAVLWVVSLAAGPGFALGTDAGLSLTGDMHGGALPAMPLLAALPGAGPLPGYTLLLLAIPVGAGGVIGWFARPAGGSRGPREELATAAAAGVACGLGIGLLAGLSGGGAGGRLANFGPDGLLVGVLLALQLAVAATTLVGARIGWEYYRGPRETVVKELTGRPAIPWQKTKAKAPDNTPIVVVAADEVEDLPAEDPPAEDPPTEDSAVVDIEDTQELAIVTPEEATDDHQDQPGD